MKTPDGYLLDALACTRLACMAAVVEAQRALDRGERPVTPLAGVYAERARLAIRGVRAARWAALTLERHERLRAAEGD